MLTTFGEQKLSCGKEQLTLYLRSQLARGKTELNFRRYHAHFLAYSSLRGSANGEAIDRLTSSIGTLERFQDYLHFVRVLAKYIERSEDKVQIKKKYVRSVPK